MAREGSDLGPSLIDGKIRYLSASQLEKFDAGVFGGCERRWWYRYVDRKKEPSGSSQKLGTQVHAQIEHYLRKGEDVLGEIARAGKRFLPAPGPDLLVEYAFGEPAWPGPVLAPIVSPLTSAGVPLIGFVDLVHNRNEWIDDAGNAQSIHDSAEVVDWKTTKQIDSVVDELTGVIEKQGYAKTAEQLAGTWQMVSYGVLAAEMWPVKTVRLSHGYFQSKGPKAASKRSALVTVEEVRARWRRSEPLVERMKSVAGEKHAKDVSANYGACKAYGGCPHRTYCPRDAKQVLAETFGGRSAALLARVEQKEEPKMSLLAKMKSGGSTKAAEPAKSAAPPAAESEKYVPTATDLEKMKADARVQIEAEKKALAAEEQRIKSGITPPDLPAPKDIADPIPADVVVSPAIRAAADAIAAGTLKSGGNGQVFDKNGADTGHILRPATDAEKAALADAFGPPCRSGAAQVELDIDAVASKKYACACGATVKVKPAKLGDGKYYAAIPKHGEAPKAEEKPAEAPPKEVATPPKEVASANTGNLDPSKVYAEILAGIGSRGVPVMLPDGFTLYHNASEDGVATTRLETYAEELCAALCAEYKAADVRCAPEGSPLSFGKWKGALAAYARSAPPAPGAYSVGDGEVVQVVFEALASSARRVVRGGK